MEGVRKPSPEIQDCYLKNIFPSMFSNTSLDFISDMGVIDYCHMIDNIENIKENIDLHKCPSKDRSFWKLVISLKTFIKKRQWLIYILYIYTIYTIYIYTYIYYL